MMGWTEMVIIGVVALVVIGPKELPVVMRNVGRFAAKVRSMSGEFQRELNKTTGLNELGNLREAVTAPLKQTAAAIRRELTETTLPAAAPAKDSAAPSIVATVEHEPQPAPATPEPDKSSARQKAGKARVASKSSGPAAKPKRPRVDALPTPSKSRVHRPPTTRSPEPVDASAVGSSDPGPIKRSVRRRSKE